MPLRLPFSSHAVLSVKGPYNQVETKKKTAVTPLKWTMAKEADSSQEFGFFAHSTYRNLED
jgi:hypothetical protein